MVTHVGHWRNISVLSHRWWSSAAMLGVLTIIFAMAAPAIAQSSEQHPWMNKSLSSDERADMVLKEMTLAEKIGLLHGEGMPGWSRVMPKLYLGNGGAGFVLAVPRLGIPQIEMSDAAYGVRMSAQNGRYSTALPANIAAAASWDPEAACDYGALIGGELRAQGYSIDDAITELLRRRGHAL